MSTTLGASIFERIRSPLLLVLFWGGVHAYAAEQSPPPDQPPVLTLSLQEAVDRALMHNLRIEVSRYAPDIAAQTERMADAFFDPELELSASQTVRDRSLDVDEEEERRTDTLVTRVIARKRLETGAILSLENRLDREDRNWRPAEETPIYESEFNINLRQPLLRGAWREAVTADRRRARMERELAGIDLEAAILDVVAATENAFARLVIAREELAMRRFSLELAETFLREAEFRLETGLATRFDVLQAEVGLAARREALVESEQHARDRNDDLIAIIGRFDAPGELDIKVHPLPPPDAPSPLPSEDEAFRGLVERRPEYRFIVERIEILELDRAVARNLNRPDLTIGGEVGVTGLDIRSGGAFREMREGDGHFWRADAILTLPWGMREDRARLRRAELFVERETTRLRHLKQDLMVELRSALRAVSASEQRLALAGEFTEATRLQFEMVEERYRAGIATSRNVLDAQEDLEESRLREMRARLDLHEALTLLRRATGDSLLPYNIEIDQVVGRS